MEVVQATDQGALFWCENHHTTIGNALMQFITLLGNPPVLITVVTLGTILFLLAGRRRTAIILLLASLLGLAMDQGFKYAIQRERPDVAWRLIDRPQSPSFPSGHALNAMSDYGALALLVSRHLRRRRVQVFLLVVGFLLPMWIGLSRPYLGVHYPSDVLAGWTAGLACALLALWADQRWGDRESSTPSFDAATGDRITPIQHHEDQADAASAGVRRASEVSGIRGSV